jgi:HAD superfamily hydrolase (TIGR01509 family)
MSSDKVIIFDVDGVLIRNFNDNKEFLWSQTIGEDLGVTPPVLKDIFSEGWHDCIRGRADTKKHVQSVFAAHDLGLPADRFIDYWHERDTNFDQEVIDCVTALQSHRLFIATNQDKLRATFLKNIFGHLFEDIFTSSDFGVMKPEDDYFRRVEETVKVRPENIIFIDDLPVNIAAARRRGWEAHLYRDVAELKKAVGLT